MHQDFVLNAPGGVGSQLDIFGGLVGVHRFNQTNGPNGNQILNAHSGVFKPAGDVHHQTEVPFNELRLDRLIPLVQAGNELRFLVPAQGRGEGVAPADVHDFPRQLQTPSGQKPLELDINTQHPI